MQKKLSIFICLIYFVFFSCLDYSLPNQIELEVEGSIGLPVKTATSNWGAILAKALKKAFSGSAEEGMDIEIYNVDYGQDAQAFCVYMPIEISESLNPSDYLKDIDDELLRLEGDVLEIRKTFDIPSNVELLSKHVIITSGSVSITYPGVPLEIGDQFLHALIEEGAIIISLDIDDIPEDQITKTYNITISQASGAPYDGFSNPPTNITSAEQSLKDHNINTNQIDISGTINISGPGALPLMEGNLTISMNISEYRELDWHMENIDETDSDPLSLTNVADVLNWIYFDPCYDENGKPYVDADGEINAGIGINVIFDTETDENIIKGLAMSVGCDALKFSDKARPLDVGSNVFGNKEELTLYLNKNVLNPDDNTAPEEHTDLIFIINLLSANPDDTEILKLKGVKVKEGEPLSITGTAKLFQNWKKANVKMAAVLKASSVDNTFEGVFPDPANTDPIDLSLLDDYIEGFEFSGKDFVANAYLSGPDKTINGNPYLLEIADLGLSIEAQYNDTSSPCMKQNPIKFEKKHIILKDNPVYLDNIDQDGNGTYKYKDKNGKASLPPDGNPFNFLAALNARPQDLVFNYKVDMPETITVEPDMFIVDGDNDITATIIMIIYLKLTAGSKGGVIKYSDMFKGQEDLLGRNHNGNDPDKPEANSMFTSLDVSYINFAVDFAGTFFNGGKLFIEKNNDSYKPILFPEGIPVDGSTIAANIHNEDFEKIKNNIIHPDFRLEFESGGTITIPRNIGLTSVKIEAKGKNSLVLDF